MRIDLHTHSDRSDGTSPPAQLVHEAADAGLDVVALADHDTADGWDQAAEAAGRIGIVLVPGMEISCKHAGTGVHLLAYLPDPTYEPLRAELARIIEGRDHRLPGMLERLRSLGIDIDEADVAAQARDASALGRPHVADALVELGVVGDRAEAFDRFLALGRPAHVQRYATPVEEMITLVADAGGVTVLAHPWGREARDGLHEEGLAVLRDRGLAGVEIDHEDHSPGQRAELRAVARSLGLVATGSSDYHGSGKTGHALGCNTTGPEEYERLMDLAAAASRAAGRRTPQVVGPR